MKKFGWGLLVIPLLMTGGYVVSDFKSSFLIDGRHLSTLSYLSDDRDEAWRTEVRNRMVQQGDTHVDILARNTDKPWGLVNSVDTANWRARLQGLRDDGFSPVIWMRGDDSPEIDALPINDQIEYNKKVVAAVDDISSHYVLALEADEYYSVPEVRVLLQNMRRETDKPIGIHLTPGMRGKEAYVEGFDVIYLQTGFDLTEEEFRREVEYALTLGKPVVVSEYHMDNSSAEAAKLGDIACSYAGVVGTGNGRGASVCGSLEWLVAEEQKEPWYDKYDDELSVFMLALVTISATYALDLPFTANFTYANDNGYEVMLAAPVNESTTVGATVSDRGRIMGFFNWQFDELFKRPSIKQGDTNERR